VLNQLTVQAGQLVQVTDIDGNYLVGKVELWDSCGITIVRQKFVPVPAPYKLGGRYEDERCTILNSEIASVESVAGVRRRLNS